MGKLVDVNGSWAISHNGKIYPPMMMTITNAQDGEHKNDHEYLKNLGKSGIKIYFLICDTTWIMENAFDELDNDMNALLSAVPDAVVMLRLGLHPSNEWIKENMEECIKYSDGTFATAFLRTESYKTDLPGCYTLYSEKWRKKAGEYLVETYNRLMEKPYKDHIAGIFFAAGSTSEWGQLGAHTIPEKGIYADCSESMKREFSLYLREKYKTEENLRRAWADDSVSFDDPKIPSLTERYYSMDMRYDGCGIDYDIKMRHRREGKPVTDDVLFNDYNVGSFLNVDKQTAVFDYYRARATATAKSLIYFGKITKELSDNLLTGAFYGNFGATHFTNSVSTPVVYDVLKSGVIDIFSAPGVYQNRQRGGFEGQRCMYDSMRINNTMFVVEDDTRTHAEIPEYLQALDLFSVEDTIEILKRNFGRNICDDLQGWWFDQHFGGGRYKHEKVYDLFKRQSEIAEEAYSFDRDKKHEIAFIYDEESVNMVGPKTTHDTIEYMRNYEIAHIGAGVDIYYHNDFANPKMPDYKLYVFFNDYCLTDKEREDIKTKLKKNNATALFMYASGLINPDADTRLSVKNIEDLTGIKMCQENTVAVPSFGMCENDILKDVDMGKTFGDLDRKITHAVIHIPDWEIGNYERGYLSPYFYPEDEGAKVIAKYKVDKKPALVCKKTDGYTSFWCGTKVVGAEVIRAIAKSAGCHIWCESDDVTFQNTKYVTIHASSTGKKKLIFPKNCTPYEVYEQKVYANNVEELEIDMLLGQTKMFRLD